MSITISNSIIGGKLTINGMEIPSDFKVKSIANGIIISHDGRYATKGEDGKIIITDIPEDGVIKRNETTINYSQNNITNYKQDNNENVSGLEKIARIEEEDPNNNISENEQKLDDFNVLMKLREIKNRYNSTGVLSDESDIKITTPKNQKSFDDFYTLMKMRETKDKVDSKKNLQKEEIDTTSIKTTETYNISIKTEQTENEKISPLEEECKTEYREIKTNPKKKFYLKSEKKTGDILLHNRENGNILYREIEDNTDIYSGPKTTYEIVIPKDNPNLELSLSRENGTVKGEVSHPGSISLISGSIEVDIYSPLKIKATTHGGGAIIGSNKMKREDGFYVPIDEEPIGVLDLSTCKGNITIRYKKQ